MNGFTITRDIAALPERVWAAFTDAGQYAAWIWPADWKTTCQIEARAAHEQGWSDCLDRLPEYLTR